jgi:ribokinase
VPIADTGDETELLKSVLVSAAKLRDKGAKQVLFTLGVRGSCLVREDGRHVRVLRQTQHTVVAVDTSGAGDCYLGALAAYLAASRTLEESLELAGKVATLSVMSKGCQSSYPSLASLPPDLWLSNVS